MLMRSKLNWVTVDVETRLNSKELEWSMDSN
jgi:hypothetical protein